MGQITEFPSSQDGSQAKDSCQRLSKYAKQGGVTMTIAEPDGAREDVVLPGYALANPNGNVERQSHQYHAYWAGVNDPRRCELFER